MSLGAELLVHAVALEQTLPASLQLHVADFVKAQAISPAPSDACVTLSSPVLTLALPYPDINTLSSVPARPFPWPSVIVRDALPRLVREVETKLARALMPDVKDLQPTPTTGGAVATAPPATSEPARGPGNGDPLRMPSREPYRPYPDPLDPLRAGPGGFGGAPFGVGRTLTFTLLFPDLTLTFPSLC